MGNTSTDKMPGLGDLEKRTENHGSPKIQRKKETDLFRAAMEATQRGVFPVEEGNKCPPEPARLVIAGLENECKLRQSDKLTVRTHRQRVFPKGCSRMCLQDEPSRKSEEEGMQRKESGTLIK